MAWTDPASGPAVVGTVAPAALWNTYVRDNLLEVGAHKRVIKSATESVFNNTLQSDDHLKFTMAANETWIWEMQIRYSDESSTTANFKLAFNSPTGSLGGISIAFTPIGLGELAASLPTTDGQYTDGGVTACEGSGAIVQAWGAIVNGSTAGDVQLRWAQNTTDGANATKVYKNSCLIAHRVG
jgi:hypothetical protein